jgi:hypothetical protein
MTTRMFEFMASPLAKGIISALISYSAHYAATKAYSTACVPDGVYGFLQGLVTSGSPVCQVGIQVMTATQVSYSTVIMMGISRLILDTVAPGHTGVETPSSDGVKTPGTKQEA